MKYLLAAVFLISTALAYPVGETEGGSNVPLVVSDYASVAKSDESGEVHSHEHHVKVHSDVSHESPKIQHDSSESSEESGSLESAEKPQEQAHPEPEVKEKPLLDDKVEHQAQPSEIINAELHSAVSPVQDPVKAEHPEVVESAIPVAKAVPVEQPAQAPQSDIIQTSESVEHLKPVLKQISELVQPTDSKVEHHSDEALPTKDESKPSEEKTKTIPEPSVPVLADAHTVVETEVKQEPAVVQSDPIDVVQPKSVDGPELKEEPKQTEELKPAEEPKLLEKQLPGAVDKPAEEPAKIALIEKPIIQEAAADPVAVQDEVVKEVVKPVAEVVADALPLPQPEVIPAKEDGLKKVPELETLPEKLSQSSSSS